MELGLKVRLFQSLIWPAIAGNVAWAFFTAFITSLTSWPWDLPVVARLAVLFFVAIYLILDWLEGEENRHNVNDVNPKFWRADLVLAVAIALYAIATERSNGQELWRSGVWLVLVFLVAMLGHWSGVWEKPNDKNSRAKALMIINGLGLAVASVATLGSYYQFIRPEVVIWMSPMAVLLVIIGWFLIRKGIV